MKVLHYLLYICLSVCLASINYAKDNISKPSVLQKALELFKKSKVDAAFGLVKDGFSQENSKECLDIGQFIDYKLRLPKKAVPFYMCAAKHGSKPALLSLRWIVTKNIREVPLHPVVDRLLKKYALQTNDGELLYAAGDLMFRSKGYKKRYPQILKFWEQSAKKSWPEAFFQIGTAYMRGTLIKQDLKKAAENFEKCIDVKYFWCANQYGEKLLTGKFFSQDVSKAKEVFNKIHEAGSGKGLSIYASHLLSGKHVKKNSKLAYELLQKLELEGAEFRPATYAQLAKCYKRGKYCPKDKVKYLNLLRKAAIRFDAKSCYKLAKLYSKGKVVPKDDIEAYLLHLMGMYYGYQPSLGASNKIVASWKKKYKNVDKHLIRFKMFCIMMQGKLKISKVYDANLNHGIALFYGIRGVYDPEQGLKLVQKSIDNGNEEAKLVLKMFLEEHQKNTNKE
ncbi:MAG: sel1 repeat family protein [Candidatus Cloacimonetes bacterium]|nr:sel1 repeat family protein [Candidatus Cloacimonadota bacterium]